MRYKGTAARIGLELMVPGRMKIQCSDRWHDALDPSVDRTSLSTGKWTADEDDQLKDAVQRHGAKNWKNIAAMVPGRTNKQCSSRWQDALNPSVDRTSPSTARWTADEDDQLKNAVHRHGGKNWIGIASLIPGRTTNSAGIDSLMP
jgi:uncharacterized protein (DUF2237 family)